jgi:carbon monoxide dehydrogenase subunit G
MSMQPVTASTIISNTPEAVLGYIADVRNRTFFLPSLKAVSNIQGDPAGANTTWSWTWTLLGVEFKGTGHSTEYQPGQVYSFKTEGAIESTWTYRVKPEGAGTRLSINVEYQVPDNLVSKIRAGSHSNEVSMVVQNLKAILDQ